MHETKIFLLALAILACTALFVISYSYTGLKFGTPVEPSESQAQPGYMPAPTPIPNATAASSGKIMLCPLEVKVSIVNSTHSYRYVNPQRVLINAERGDVISIVLKASLDPNLLSCVREALELETIENIHVEYGLKLGSEDLIAVEPGVKSMDISSTELKDLEGGLYKLTITVGNVIEPGIYRVELDAYLKMNGDKIVFEGSAEYAIYLDIK